MIDSLQLSIIVAFGAGLFSFFSPCILPLIPAYVSFISGISIDEMKASEDKVKNLKRILLETILFISGFSLVFVLLGATATFLGSFILSYQQILRIVGGIIVILFGLYMLGVFTSKYLEQEKRFFLKKKPINIFGSVLIGMVFALGWTPCIGPILASLLIYASTQESLKEGITLLTFYSLGLALPFLITSLAINAFLSLFKKINKYFGVIKIASGALLILVGILIMTNNFHL